MGVTTNRCIISGSLQYVRITGQSLNADRTINKQTKFKFENRSNN